MKQILITGGAGFVGSYLCNAFKILEYDVVAVDDLSNGKESNIKPGIHFENIDLSTNDIFTKLSKYVNFVPIVALYAELHYKFPFIKSRYYIDEPEINEESLETANTIKFLSMNLN